METQELNIKPQNLKYHCCTCLNKLGADKHEMNAMKPELLLLFQQFAGEKNMLNDLFPKCICAQCYEKLEIIDEFQRTSKKSMLFLEELVESFKHEPNDEYSEKEMCSKISYLLGQSEKHAVNIENSKIDDPLLCSDRFEEVIIKPEANENELLDFKEILNYYMSNKLGSSIPDEESTIIDEKLAFQNIKICFQCDKCELSFDKKRQLNSHMNKEHKKSATRKIRCKFGCGKTFRFMATAEKHYKTIHPNFFEINSNEQNKTLQNGEKFVKHFSLKTKIKEKLQQLGCYFPTESKRRIKAENGIDGSPATMSKTTCPICVKNFSSVSGLNVHMRIHLDARPFPCDKCDRGFNKRALLTNHLKEIHAESPIEIVCKYGCGRVFLRQDSAMNHYRLKHILPLKGIKPDYTRVCEECGKVFKNISILKEHRNIHLPPEERPYKCDQCDKRFSMKKNLTMHLMRHAGIKNFECTVCGLKTTTRRELRLHMNFHTKELRVECPICSKAFNSPANMKRHEQVVHQGIKKYSCHFCDEKFGKPDTLKHHVMRHTGEKPHKCDQCNKSFIQLVALKAHMKTHNKPAKLKARDQHVVEEEDGIFLDVRQLL